MGVVAHGTVLLWMDAPALMTTSGQTTPGYTWMFRRLEDFWPASYTVTPPKPMHYL